MAWETQGASQPTKNTKINLIAKIQTAGLQISEFRKLFPENCIPIQLTFPYSNSEKRHWDKFNKGYSHMWRVR